MSLNTIEIPEQRTIYNKAFPLVVAASSEESQFSDSELHQWVRAHREELHERLIDQGAVLLRGFPVASAEAFEALLDQTQYRNMPYIGGAAPRNKVTESRIVTANEAPASESIPFHHEMAQVPVPPGYIFFYCETASESGGSTSLLHSGEVCETFFALNPDFAQAVESEGVCYTRVMPPQTDTTSPIGRSWRETFNTESREAAEFAMKEAGMTWEWLADDNLRTKTKTLPAIRFDSEVEQRVFFNSIVAVYNGWDDSRNEGKKAVTTGSGKLMDAEVIETLTNKMAQMAVNFRWQPGDVLMINNHTVLHARQPYTGERRILAAIAYKG
jgi:alpha-ketoglutarate-dependent taurine dioxygenase